MTETAAAGTVTIPARGVYEVDPERSEISLATRHMFGLGKVSGRFRIGAGRITVADPIGASEVQAHAEAASFATGLAGRDRKVRSKKFLDADAHPRIEFRSSRLTEQAGRWVLEGILTVKGQQGPFELTITEAAADGESLSLVAVGTVDRYTFGVTAMKGMAGRHLRLTVTLRATRV